MGGGGGEQLTLMMAKDGAQWLDSLPRPLPIRRDSRNTSPGNGPCPAGAISVPSHRRGTRDLLRQPQRALPGPPEQGDGVHSVNDAEMANAHQTWPQGRGDVLVGSQVCIKW